MSTELLKKIYLFDGLSVSELVELLKICRQERYEEGKFIFLEGDTGDKCYVIEEGEVRISKYVPNVGEEALTLLRQGSFFGEMSLIDGATRSATAIANKPTTCLVMDKSDLERLMDEDRELGTKLLWAFCRTLTRRLRDTNEKISSFIAMTVGLGGPV